MQGYKDIICEQYDPNKTVDILIIGAGLSGLQVAKDLSIRNVGNVWVFEAGPNLGLQHLWWTYDDKYAQKMWQLLIEDPSFHRPWISNTPPHYEGTSGLRRRLGGRSLYWHGGILPIESWALQPPWWPKSIVQDLTEGTDGSPSLYELQEQEITSDPATKGTEYLVALLQSAGYTQAKPMPLAVHYRQLQNGDIRWAAYSPLDFWRQEMEQSNFASLTKLPRIACNTEVVSVLADRGKVTGVQVRNIMTGEAYNVNCPRVVLAAGTIENTRLALGVLMSSKQIKQPILPGLMDHLNTGCMYQVELDQVPSVWNSSKIPSFALIPGTEDSKFNLFVSITSSEVSNRTITIDTWAIGEQMPQPENVIYLDFTQSEPQKVHIIADRSLSDQEMIKRHEQALNDLLKSLMQSLGPSATLLPRPSYSSAQGVDDFCNALQKVLSPSATILAPTPYVSPLGTVDHEGGTLPFGSILHDTGEFMSISGLYAVGPCTFPRMGAANPSLTTLALAKRTAYHLSKT